MDRDKKRQGYCSEVCKEDQASVCYDSTLGT